MADSLTMLYVGAAIGGVGAGVDLRRLRRQCAEMVSGPARSRGRTDRGGFRRGLGAHHHSDRQHDQDRAATSPPSCGSASGRASWWCRGAAAARAASRRSAGPGSTRSQQTRRDYGSAGSAEDAGVLGHVPDVRDGRRRRPDGDGAARADRQGLQGRRRPGVDPRPDACRR